MKNMMPWRKGDPVLPQAQEEEEEEDLTTYVTSLRYIVGLHIYVASLHFDVCHFNCMKVDSALVVTVLRYFSKKLPDDSTNIDLSW